ncbi:hypothetical protein SDC9_145125 [bioreactor metagenome]|uniref:Uncharacterized protein n=1 Tax=bioreactor metagenome TaxID=1076179 RepID=A0A645E7P5_9ZZZZ
MIKKPQIERFWVICPYCGAKVCIYDNTAHASGVYMKCSRNTNCKKEFELKIENGKQII